MPGKNLKEIRLNLPVEIANSFRDKDIIDMLGNKMFTKMTYFLSRNNEMEQKYGMNYNAFRKKVNNSKKENYSFWDDLLLWEGYLLAYREWSNKVNQLKQCIQ